MVLILGKKILSVLLVLALFAVLGVQSWAAEEELSAQCAIVYEPRTGTVLMEKAADERMLVASTTKIMTAMIVLAHCGLNEAVSVTPAHAAVEGSSMYLKPGGDYVVEDLLYGLMLASGNDAAAALADHCAGSMEDFAALMNKKCEQLGLKNTHFVNAHGLDAPGHYSSARDLAVITAAAMENPDFCRIFAARSYPCGEETYYNHNKLLTSCEGCVGGKTGYTNAAGRVLVSCAEREGMRLICVTISDPNDWEDHRMLYDRCFAEYRYVPLPGSGWDRIPVICGTKSHARLICDMSGLVLPGKGEVQLSVRLPRFIFAPALYGAMVGSVEVYSEGIEPQNIPISLGETVTMDSTQLFSSWELFKRAWFMANRAGIYQLST